MGREFRRLRSHELQAETPGRVGSQPLNAQVCRRCKNSSALPLGITVTLGGRIEFCEA